MRLLRRELAFQDLVRVGYFKAKAFPEGINNELRRGSVCHGFFDGEQLVTIGWTSREYLELDVDVRITCPAEIGLFDFLTFEDFRSKGYYTSALSQLVMFAKEKGFERACIAVDPGNAASIKGIERAGFRRVMLVSRHVRFGIRRIVTENYLASSD